MALMLPPDSGASPHSDGTGNICQRKKKSGGGGWGIKKKVKK